MEGQRVRDPELSDLVFQFFVYDSLSDVFGTCKSKGVLLSIEDNCWKLTNWLGKKETWEQTVLDKNKWNLMKTSIPIWSKNPDMFPPMELRVHRIHKVLENLYDSWGQLDMTFEQQITVGTTHEKINHCNYALQTLVRLYKRFLPMKIANIESTWNLKTVMSYHGPLWTVDLVRFQELEHNRLPHHCGYQAVALVCRPKIMKWVHVLSSGSRLQTWPLKFNQNRTSILCNSTSGDLAIDH